MLVLLSKDRRLERANGAGSGADDHPALHRGRVEVAVIGIGPRLREGVLKSVAWFALLLPFHYTVGGDAISTTV